MTWWISLQLQCPRVQKLLFFMAIVFKTLDIYIWQSKSFFIHFGGHTFLYDINPIRIDNSCFIFPPIQNTWNDCFIKDIWSSSLSYECRLWWVRHFCFLSPMYNIRNVWLSYVKDFSQCHDLHNTLANHNIQ
jgi:hypothetical protein